MTISILLAISSPAMAQGVHHTPACILKAAANDNESEDQTITVARQVYKLVKIHTVQIAAKSGSTFSTSSGTRTGDGTQLLDRDLLLVPLSGKHDNREPSPTWDPGFSPNHAFLTVPWEINNSLNGVALYRRVDGPRAQGLRFRLQVPNLSYTIRKITDNDKSDLYNDDGPLLSILNWHGREDRYLHFAQGYRHAVGDFAHGIYDTLTEKISIESWPKIGSRDPRLEGERFPQTRWRRMLPSEIERMTYPQVRYAINELYARYGMLYEVDDHIVAYFQKFDWYWPVGGHRPSRSDFERHELTSIERANLKLLKARRNKLLHKPANWEDEYD